jgi:hypothetical protein
VLTILASARMWPPIIKPVRLSTMMGLYCPSFASCRVRRSKSSCFISRGFFGLGLSLVIAMTAVWLAIVFIGDLARPFILSGSWVWFIIEAVIGLF